MSLTKDLSDQEFEKLSITKKKNYVANLLIKSSHAQPVPPSFMPIAIIMAGVPGAGKTEFLDTLSELIIASKLQPFVRIDLDEIVTIYPGYTPKTDAQFRSQGNSAVSKCVDVGKEGRYNMMIDGTFAGTSGASVHNIQRLLDAGYLVQMYLMHDKIHTSWEYTKVREKLTSRGIHKSDFKKACVNVISNVKSAKELFSSADRFLISVVRQKELRDKNYVIIEEPTDIDKILDTGYSIDIIEKIL